MKTYTDTELQEILSLHTMWLRGEEGGERANLSGADLSGADLSGADLSGADLFRANLFGADLYKTIGDGVIIRSLQLPRYHVNIWGDYIQIGCEKHTVAEWAGFDGNEINEMDHGALDWWAEWKDTVLFLAEKFKGAK